MKKNNNLSGMLLVQLAIGINFFITGLLGVLGYNSGTNQLVNGINDIMGETNYLPLIISITVLMSGFILIAGLFFNLKGSVIYLIITVLWLVFIIYNYFTDNFLKPDTLYWLRDISSELIILAGLWSISIKK